MILIAFADKRGWLTGAWNEAAQKSDFASGNVDSVDGNNHVSRRDHARLGCRFARLQLLNNDFGAIFVERFVKNNANPARVFAVRILRIDGGAVVAAGRAHSGKVIS